MLTVHRPDNGRSGASEADGRTGGRERRLAGGRTRDAAIDEARRHPITEDREDYTAMHTAVRALVGSGDQPSNRTLAQRLGLSPETIRTQLKKARKQAAGILALT